MKRSLVLAFLFVTLTTNANAQTRGATFMKVMPKDTPSGWDNYEVKKPK